MNNILRLLFKGPKYSWFDYANNTFVCDEKLILIELCLDVQDLKLN